MIFDNCKPLLDPTWKCYGLKKFQRINIILFFLLFLTDNIANASCCSSASSFVSRLLKHERAAFILNLGVSQSFAYFDEQRNLIKYDFRKFEPSLLILSRIFFGIEPFIKIPVSIESSKDHTAAEFKDILTGLSFGTNNLGRQKFLSSILFSSALLLPNKDKNSSLVFFPSIFFTSNIANFIIGYGYSFGYPISYAKKMEGQRHIFMLSASYFLHDGSSLGLSISPQVHSSMRINNVIVKDTNKEKISLYFLYKKPLHSHINTEGSLGMDMPFFGKNVHASFFLNLGLRIGVF